MRAGARGGIGLLLGAALALGLEANAMPACAQIPGARIEKLMEEGWEVAGYVAAWENRTLILLRHKDRHYLIQCSVLIDVTRQPRVATTCYELR